MPNERLRKRILIVNAYMDDARRPTRRPTTVLKAMGPTFLAGAFCRERCEIRLYDEQSSGPLEDPRLLGWPDMLVLTGLTSAFDRMLHLTAYARTRNEDVVVAAGGPAIRLLRDHASSFFDYCCTGDVEEILDVIRDALGASFADPRMIPRYDLTYWIRTFGHVESTRNCNFACSFCSLTAEGNAYLKLGVEQLRAQIEAGGRRRFLLLIDNNFYGGDRQHFLARVELLREMRAEGWFSGFGALVTSDFFAREDNLRLVREAGCEALFSGVETFDRATLQRFNKRQNTALPQVEMIRRCLDAGILLVYGLIADVTTRRIRDIDEELRFVTSCSEITLPTFVALPVPFPGTPFFRDAASSGRILPSTKLRDLDGTTLCVQPLDPLADVARFVRELQYLRGHRLRALTHAFGFLRRYRKSLTSRQLVMAMARDISLAGIPLGVSAGRSPLAARLRRATAPGGRRTERTHISTTELLDDLYTPAFPVEARFRDHFRPTPITDERGRLVPQLADELMGLVPSGR